MALASNPSKQEIHKQTRSVSSLDQRQRSSVEDSLNKLKSKTGGTLYKGSVEKELGKLRKTGKISDVDLRNLKKKFLSDK